MQIQISHQSWNVLFSYFVIIKLVVMSGLLFVFVLFDGTSRDLWQEQEVECLLVCFRKVLYYRWTNTHSPDGVHERTRTQISPEYENIPLDHPTEDHCIQAMLLDRQTDLTLAHSAAGNSSLRKSLWHFQCLLRTFLLICSGTSFFHVWYGDTAVMKHSHGTKEVTKNHPNSQPASNRLPSTKEIHRLFLFRSLFLGDKYRRKPTDSCKKYVSVCCFYDQS